ncbi:MAG: hypothetical protein VCE91_09135 [Nitrospinota bacterium]
MENISAGLDNLSPGDWLSRAIDSARRGEFLEACDLATRALAEHPSDIWLQHRAVLSLAQAGARSAPMNYTSRGAWPNTLKRTLPPWARESKRPLPGGAAW